MSRNRTESLPESQSKADFIPFSVPAIGEEEEEAVLRVLRSGWLTTAKEALAFEEEFAAFVTSHPAGGPHHEDTGFESGGSCQGKLHALAVNSATSGLQLAYLACGVGGRTASFGFHPDCAAPNERDSPGRILTTPYTFVSTATAACRRRFRLCCIATAGHFYGDPSDSIQIDLYPRMGLGIHDFRSHTCFA